MMVPLFVTASLCIGIDLV